MSLSKYIQSPDLLMSIPGKKTFELKSTILEKGLQWYNAHPDEAELIRNNLQMLELPCDNQILENTKKNIILHYFEKLLPLCGGPQFYFDFLRSNIDFEDSIRQLEKTISKGNGVLLAIAHFGAVEFLAPLISSFKLPLNVVLRFTTEQFSRIAHERAKTLEMSGLFGHINFIEIGKPGSSTALDMAAALRRKEILISVFDEKTDYSKPVNLFGRKVYGGAGLDRLIQFANVPVDVFNAFVIREENDRYRLDLKTIDLSGKNMIQQMYDNLSSHIIDITEQWYFLHEEIPFLND